MTQSELKRVASIGAELGAAKAENEAMRAALEEVLAAAGGRHLRPWLAIEAARAALSQQAEPTDTFTAVDMATAAAQGFRDGQAAVEQAAAQDEREAVEVVAWLNKVTRNATTRPVQVWDWDDEGEPVEALMSVAQHERIVAALSARPAQTEQQPFGWVTEDYLTDKSATTYDQVVADRWRAKGWPVREIYTDPIAQTTPQGKFRMGDLVKKSSGSEWESADERTVEILRRRDDYELRQLVPLTALSAVTAERDRLREDRDSQQRVCIAEMEKANQLRAEVETLRKDAERYRWASSGVHEAETLVSIVNCHGGYAEKVAERVDVYREAAMAAKEPEHEHVCSGCGAKGWTGNCLECIPY